MPDCDLVIRGGRVFDGSGEPSRQVDLAVADGRIVEMAPDVDVGGAARVVDARGKWVTPGFIDIHTHYDAEVLVAPSLGESVRSGPKVLVTPPELDRPPPGGLPVPIRAGRR